MILQWALRGFDIVVIYLACHGFGIEYTDIWRTLTVVAFSWLVGLVLAPLLILAAVANPPAPLIPWLGVLFGSLCMFIAVKYVMMVDWHVAAKIGAVFLVGKVLAQFLIASLRT